MPFLPPNQQRQSTEGIADILRGVKNSKTGQLTLTTPLSGRFFIGRVGPAMVNQCTKF